MLNTNMHYLPSQDLFVVLYYTEVKRTFKRTDRQVLPSTGRLQNVIPRFYSPTGSVQLETSIKMG